MLFILFGFLFLFFCFLGGCFVCFFLSWLFPFYSTQHLIDISWHNRLLWPDVFHVVAAFPRWCAACIYHPLPDFPSETSGLFDWSIDSFSGSWKIHFLVSFTADVLIIIQQVRGRNRPQRVQREVHRRSTESSIRLKCGFVGRGRKSEQNTHDIVKQQMQSSAGGGWLWVLWPYRGVRGVKSSNIPLLSLTPICLRLHVTESFSRNIKAKQHLHVSLFQIDKNKTRKNDPILQRVAGLHFQRWVISQTLIYWPTYWSSHDKDHRGDRVLLKHAFHYMPIITECYVC